VESVNQTSAEQLSAMARPKPAGLPVADAQKNEAMLRVAAYFRSLGLRDHDVIHRLVGEVLDSVFAHAVTLEADGHDLLGASLHEASARTNRWLDVLLAAAGVTMPTHASRGMLLMRLRPMLATYPQAYGQTTGLPAPLLQVIRNGGVQVVPPVVRSEMDPQAIGELPEMMSGAFWRRIVDRVRAWGGHLFATLGGR
jgi:hypothetical protein